MKVTPIGVDDQQDELANRVLFSVLSNDRFKTFLREYQEKKNRALARFPVAPDDKQAATDLDERTIKMEFAEALLEFGDKELLTNLLDSSGAAALPWWVLVLVVVVAVHAVVFLGTSGDFAPTTSEDLPIPAQELRKIADQLVAAAWQARAAGDLTP